MAAADASLPTAFCTAHKGVRKSWDLPESFPDPAVVEAYAAPKVDESRARWAAFFYSDGMHGPGGGLCNSVELSFLQVVRFT